MDNQNVWGRGWRIIYNHVHSAKLNEQDCSNSVAVHFVSPFARNTCDMSADNKRVPCIDTMHRFNNPGLDSLHHNFKQLLTQFTINLDCKELD